MANRWSVLLAVCVTLSVPRPAPADDQAELKALLARAVKAQGGEARLARFKAATLKFKGKAYVMGEIDYTAEWTTQFPDQHKGTVQVVVDGNPFTFGLVVNKDKGWINENGNVKAMDKDRLAEEKEQLYARTLTALMVLKGKDVKLSPVGEVKVGKHDAVGIKVGSKGHRDVNLYFDKKTALLLKMETNVKPEGSDKEVSQETFYHKYKKFDGVLRPTRLQIKRDGKKYVDVTEVTEYKPLEKLDDSEFAKP